MTAVRNLVTKVLLCDPALITFTASSQLLISLAETLASLEAAVYDLVSLKTPVGFPSETVYGLAAPALCSLTVSQILSIKG